MSESTNAGSSKSVSVESKAKGFLVKNKNIFISVAASVGIVEGIQVVKGLIKKKKGVKKTPAAK